MKTSGTLLGISVTCFSVTFFFSSAEWSLLTVALGIIFALAGILWLIPTELFVSRNDENGEEEL